MDIPEINRQAKTSNQPWRVAVVVDAGTLAVKAQIHPHSFTPEMPHTRAALGYVVSRAQQGGALETAALRALMAFNTPSKKQ